MRLRLAPTGAFLDSLFLIQDTRKLVSYADVFVILASKVLADGKSADTKLNAVHGKRKRGQIAAACSPRCSERSDPLGR
jgi:hypothetical protein